MRLRWSSIGGQDEGGYLAATVAEYGPVGQTYFMAFMAQQPLLDEHGERRRFASEADARAAVDELVYEAALERAIADLDASVAE